MADLRNHRIQVLNSDLMHSSSFGREGIREGDFYFPHDILFDIFCRMYVADLSNHRIQVFLANGQYVQQFGKKGGGDGELNSPSSIAVNPTTDVVCVSKYGSHHISIIDTKGEFVKAFGTKGTGPAQFHELLWIRMESSMSAHNHHLQVF